MEGCPNPPQKPSTIHPLFDDKDADVTFQSVDNIQFQVQRKFLEANTGAFPGAEFDTRGEITHLTETAKVLELLFQFVYPKRHPDVEELPFWLLADLAEAAEKYEVFFAMEICRLHMKRFLPKEALEVLRHAAKHDYPRLIRDAIPYLARSPLASVADMLPPRYVLPWIHYHEAWSSLFEENLKNILSLRISSPSTGSRPGNFFAASLKPQVCHSCLVLMINTLQEFKELASVEELNAALVKPRPPVSGCLSSACQYPTAFATICLDMKTKGEGISFSIP